MIVSVRKLDNAPFHIPTAHRRIKTEPGLESSSSSPVPRTKSIKPTKKPKKPTSKHARRTCKPSQPTPHPRSRSGSPNSSTLHPHPHFPLPPLPSTFDDDPYNAFSQIGDLTMPPSNLGPCDDSFSTYNTSNSAYFPHQATTTSANDAMFGGISSPLGCHAPSTPPPAYQPKPIEQLLAEANGALEERMYSRLTKDIAKTVAGAMSSGGGGVGLYGKRGRAVISLDEAEANLRAAGDMYAKAKQAEERRANKRVKGSGKRDEGDEGFGGEKGGKGEKGGLGGW